MNESTNLPNAIPKGRVAKKSTGARHVYTKPCPAHTAPNRSPLRVRVRSRLPDIDEDLDDEDDLDCSIDSRPTTNTASLTNTSTDSCRSLSDSGSSSESTSPAASVPKHRRCSLFGQLATSNARLARRMSQAGSSARSNGNDNETQVRYGVGIGKGGIRRIARRMNRRVRQESGMRSIRSAEQRLETQTYIKSVSFRKDIVNAMQKARPGESYKIETKAIFALKEASEAYLLQIFEAANQFVHHAHRVTLMSRDLAMVMRFYKN